MNDVFVEPVKTTKTAFVWGKWGPYHLARFNAFRKLVPDAMGIQFAADSGSYLWQMDGLSQSGVETLHPSRKQEDLGFSDVFGRVRKILKRESVETVFLPSYSPMRCFGALMAARSVNARCIMMNETHAGTASNSVVKEALKKTILRQFDGGLVGGTPQREYFQSLGMRSSDIREGYDVVDNDFYASHSQVAKSDKRHVRQKHGLPTRYVLSLGRFVEKKNLTLLVKAYAKLAKRSNEQEIPVLLLVGEGQEEQAIRDCAAELNIPMFQIEKGKPPEQQSPAIALLGFQQADDVAEIMSLADCFVLPSLYEEWGLVVNEAMACGLPVVVSQSVGSVVDLVRNDVNGLLFNPESVESLEAALFKVVSDEDLRLQMGVESLSIISQWNCDLFAKSAFELVIMNPSTNNTSRASWFHSK